MFEFEAICVSSTIPSDAMGRLVDMKTSTLNPYSVLNVVQGQERRVGGGELL